MAESRMNLAALQQRDPFISEIIDTASQVALYSFSSKTNEWEKTSIEGTLFIYRRSAAPLFGFMILNRLGLQNLIEPFSKTLEFQVQEPFLLYRNDKNIFGIWFYEKNECSRLGLLMNKTAQSVQQTTPELSNISVNSVTHIRMTQQNHQAPHVAVPQAQESSASSTVDIMKILTKAQHEYDQSKSTVVVKRSEPQSMTDNLGSGIYSREQPLIRPTPVKQETRTMKQEGNSPEPGTQSGDNPMSIEALFRKASINQHRPELPDVTKPSALQRSISQPDGDNKQDLHPLLMQLINRTPTVDQIEQDQTSLRERNPSQGTDELHHSPRSSDSLPAPLLKPSEVVSHPPQVYMPRVSSSDIEKDVGGSISCPDVLLSPMAFTNTTGSKLNPSNPSSSASLNVTGSDHLCLSESSELEESCPAPVAALTKQQLQQAFSYLLKNDTNFMSTLHEAYLKSLQELTKK